MASVSSSVTVLFCVFLLAICICCTFLLLGWTYEVYKRRHTGMFEVRQPLILIISSLFLLFFIVGYIGSVAIVLALRSLKEITLSRCNELLVRYLQVVFPLAVTPACVLYLSRFWLLYFAVNVNKSSSLQKWVELVTENEISHMDWFIRNRNTMGNARFLFKIATPICVVISTFQIYMYVSGHFDVAYPMDLVSIAVVSACAALVRWFTPRYYDRLKIYEEMRVVRNCFLALAALLGVSHIAFFYAFDMRDRTNAAAIYQTVVYSAVTVCVTVMQLASSLWVIVQRELACGSLAFIEDKPTTTYEFLRLYLKCMFVPWKFDVNSVPSPLERMHSSPSTEVLKHQFSRSTLQVDVRDVLKTEDGLYKFVKHSLLEYSIENIMCVFALTQLNEEIAKALEFEDINELLTQEQENLDKLAASKPTTALKLVPSYSEQAEIQGAAADQRRESYQRRESAAGRKSFTKRLRIADAIKVNTVSVSIDESGAAVDSKQSPPIVKEGVAVALPKEGPSIGLDEVGGRSIEEMKAEDGDDDNSGGVLVKPKFKVHQSSHGTSLSVSEATEVWEKGIGLTSVSKILQATPGVLKKEKKSKQLLEMWTPSLISERTIVCEPSAQRRVVAESFAKAHDRFLKSKAPMCVNIDGKLRGKLTRLYYKRDSLQKASLTRLEVLNNKVIKHLLGILEDSMSRFRYTTDFVEWFTNHRKELNL